MFKLVAIFAILALTAHAATDLHFLVMGDWGGQGTAPYYTTGETDIAAEMGKLATSKDSQFVLAVGDNFYHDGVTNEYDPRFEETFQDVFVADSLQNIPFYVICGNHDHYGNCTGEIYYSNHSSRWVFPDFYYTFEHPVGSKVAQFIMIDTVLLTGNVADQEDVEAQPLGAADPKVADDHWSWIANQLKASKADFLFVVGHYPVYSGCSHGNTAELVDQMKPMLEQYGAHYISGHDHCEEYITENGVGYFLSGSAHGDWYAASQTQNLPSGSLKYILDSSNHGSIASACSSWHLTEDGFHVDFISDQGTTLYTTETWAPRNKSLYMTE